MKTLSSPFPQIKATVPIFRPLAQSLWVGLAALVFLATSDATFAATLAYVGSAGESGWGGNDDYSVYQNTGPETLKVTIHRVHAEYLDDDDNTCTVLDDSDVVTYVSAGSTVLGDGSHYEYYSDGFDYWNTWRGDLQYEVTLNPQSITFSPLFAKTYGDVPFTLSATASSSLPITYTSSNPAVATVSGNTVTVTGVGTVTITASQAGNAIYSAAGPVSQSFTVFNITPPTITTQPANQTVTAQLANQPVGPGGNLTGKIAPGSSHYLALHDDGTVWAWGQNYSSQLGDGTTTYRSAPVQVSGLTGCVAIAAGVSHSLAVTSAGTVWAWGDNSGGQLGDGTTTNRQTPVQVNGLSNIRMVSAGYSHSLALANDGTVWAWGNNGYGQLGNGTWANRSTPVQLSGLTGCVAVAAGWFHSMALKSDGTVWAWGFGSFGQVGDGTMTCQVAPVQVNGLSGITALAAGCYHSLAVKNDGTVWAWGYNGNGQLGDGTTTLRPTPILVTGLTGCTTVAANFLYSWALKNNGTIWAWGYNGGGQLGDGTTIDRWAPVQVIGFSEPGAVVGAFSVVATGHPPPTYQWQRKAAGQTVFTNLTADGTYNGVNTATLTVRVLTVTMSGDQFQCMVANQAGNVTSNAATLTVVGPPAAPTITSQPQSQIVATGVAVALNVTASGNPTPAYQWRKNGVNLNGATAATLTLTGVQTTDSGSYTVVVSNSGGSITSSGAVLTVLQPLPVIASGLTVIGTCGTELTYTITATNSPSSYSATGLPAGLLLNTSTGVIGGTPSQYGTFPVELNASNAFGSGPSAVLTLYIAMPPTQGATLGANGRYTAGGTITIACTITYGGTVDALGWQMEIPAGWSYASSSGGASIAPRVGAEGTLGWAWASVPASPVGFTCTLNVPLAASGDKPIPSSAIVRQNGVRQQLPGNPNPLILRQNPQ